MWKKLAHTLSHLTKLCFTKVKVKWTEVTNNAFVATKKILGRGVLLSYSKFIKRFIIHTDASNTHHGVVNNKNGKSIAFYTRKLTPAQINYTTTERELLSNVENLKEFRIIIL